MRSPSDGKAVPANNRAAGPGAEGNNSKDTESQNERTDNSGTNGASSRVFSAEQSSNKSVGDPKGVVEEFTRNLEAICKEVEWLEGWLGRNQSSRSGIRDCIGRALEARKNLESLKKVVKINKREENQETKESILSKIRAAASSMSVNRIINHTNLLDLEWPPEAFRKTKVVKGYPSTHKNMAFLFSNNPVENKGLADIVNRAFDNPEGVLEQGTVADGFQVVEKSSGVRGRNLSRTLGFVVDGFQLNVVEKMISEVKSLQLKEIGIAGAGKVDLIDVRKFLEMWFYDTEIEVTIFLPPGKRSDLTDEIKKQNKHSEKEVDVIRVNSSISYADMVNKVRENVIPGQIGVTVKNTKKTNKDELLIMIEKGADQLPERLIEKIMENAVEINGLQATKVSQRRPYIIAGLEGFATEADITKAIEGCIGEHSTDIDLEVKRLTEQGKRRRSAEIWINRAAGEKLEKVGKLEIGWGFGFIKRKIKVERCIKCLKMGHHSSECKNKNAKSGCFNCTQEGHAASDCSNPAFCYICKTPGHRPDSSRCPKFRELINRQ